MMLHKNPEVSVINQLALVKEAATRAKHTLLFNQHLKTDVFWACVPVGGQDLLLPPLLPYCAIARWGDRKGTPLHFIQKKSVRTNKKHLVLNLEN